MCTCVCREGGRGVGGGAMATGSKRNHNCLFPGLHECSQACSEIPWQIHPTPCTAPTVDCWFWCCKIDNIPFGLVRIHWAIFQHNTPSKRWHIKPQGQKYVQLFPSNKVFLCVKITFSGSSLGTALCKECNPSIHNIKSPRLVFLFSFPFCHCLSLTLSRPWLYPDSFSVFVCTSVYAPLFGPTAIRLQRFFPSSCASR